MEVTYNSPMQKNRPYLAIYNASIQVQIKNVHLDNFEILYFNQKSVSDDLITDICSQTQEHRIVVVLNAQTQLPQFWSTRLLSALINTKDQGLCSALSCRVYGLSPLVEGDEFKGSVKQLDNLIFLMQKANYFYTDSINRECFAVQNNHVLKNLDNTPYIACSNLLVQTQKGKKLVLTDKKETGNQKPLPAHGLADLQWQLKHYLKHTQTNLSYPLLDDKPIILHITMGWGGGVHKWIDDYAKHETNFHHLILASSGELYRQRHGECLQLHCMKTDGVVMQNHELQSPIAATCITHKEYKIILTEIIEQFSIGTIMVSSLIGHSMDCLQTGLPTIRILHDYFPSWPSLIANLDKTKLTTIDLNLALEHTKKEPFGEIPKHKFSQWQQHLHKIYKSKNITLVAPSESVVENLQKIDNKAFDKIKVIPHAIEKFETIDFKPQDKNFKVLILGRVNPPKGQVLLEEIMQKLGKDIQFVMLGAGNEGKKYLPEKNIKVIMDYRNEQLPLQLGKINAHIALITSQTSETYNYTLSELQQAAICTVSTRYGALKNRIINGETGFLCEDNADDFVAIINKLQNQPELIKTVVQNLKGIKPFSFSQEIKAYNVLLNLSQSTYVVNTDGLKPTVFAQNLLRTDRERNRIESLLEKTERELCERANWAKNLTSDLKKAAKDISVERGEVKKLEKIITQERLILKQETTRLMTEIKVVNNTLTVETTRMQAEIEQLNNSFESLNKKFEKLQIQLQHSEQSLYDTQFAKEKAEQQLQSVENEIQAIYQSRSWRVTKPLRKVTTWTRHKRNALRFRMTQVRSFPTRTIRSLKTRGFIGTLGIINSKFSKNKLSQEKLKTVELSQDFTKIQLNSVKNPTVSIIIPVYNHFKHTYNCLKSISHLTDNASYEVIVIDDFSTDDTPKLIKRISGIRFKRQKQNGGFIESCNTGAKLANGTYLMFLNNDTVVYDKWLDALIDVFESQKDAGLVGSKLVYPNNQLQEAGGIVFSDASGWNYGRLSKPDEPQFNHVREADYCSGASILIRKDLFEQLGRFDERYKPAYYEDTDLAFAVRNIGKKVYYQPASKITHFEGISSGTDLTQGMKKYQVVNQTKFKEKWAQALAQQPKNGSDIELCRIHAQPKRILIFDACTPTPDQDSGSLRMLNLIKILKELGYHVIFMPENLSYNGNYTSDLQQLGVECIYTPHITNPVDYLKEKGKYLDVVMLSRYYVAEPVMPFIRAYCPKAQIIFDTVDLHYVRERRMAELADDKKLAKIAEETRIKELKVAKECDVTLVVSPYEVEVLAEELPETQVKVLTNIHKIYGCRKSFKQRKDIMFIGGYQHTPNVDAIEWFVKDIFPLIEKELPDLKFHIIGSRAPKHIQSMAKDSIVFQGFVENIEPVMDDIRIAVAPLRFGAGVKGKVNMSMSYGQPVVGTKVAVEGMYTQDEIDCLMAQTPEQFAKQVIRLYQNEQLWNQISKGGLENVQNYFSFEAAKTAIENILMINK